MSESSRSSESLSEQKSSKCTRKSYTINEKLSALRKLKEFDGNISKTSRALDIDRKTLREWKCNEEKFFNMSKKNTKRRCPGGVNKAFWLELEEHLFKWVQIERLNYRNIVNYRRLREKAYDLAKDLKINNFLGSNKWIKNFCRRHKLSLRKITHVGQEDNRRPEEQRDNAIEHLATLELMTADFNADMIFNMDETPVYIDMLSSSTISFAGEKTTEANGTGHDKTRFTVVLTVSAAGKILKTMVILKGLKKVPKVKVPEDIFLTVSMKGSMKEELMKEWIGKCYNRRGPFFSTSKSLLIMDNYGTHKKESVLAILNKLNTVVKFIPANTTNYLQPLDVAVNSSFKAALKAEFENWMSSGQKEFTPKGYRKKPNWETVLKFVADALKAIKKESIMKGFESCGIAPKGLRVEYEKLNSKLRSVLMGVSVEDSDIKAVESDSDQESLAIVDANSDTEIDLTDEEIEIEDNYEQN